MCLLLLLHRVREDYPIVFAANRDEFFDRPSAAPELSKDGRVIAPRDLRAGGTWIGVNRDGLFAGITNRSGAPFDTSRPSRGGICRLALDAASAKGAAKRVIESVEARPTNAFNLMLADASDALVIHFVPDRAETIHLAPGLHVLTNLHDVDRLFVKEIPERFEPLARAGDLGEDELLAALGDVARDHTVRAPGDHAICKHFEGRGTVSSSLVLAGGKPPRSRVRFLYAPGPPCTTPYESVPGTFS